MSKGYLSRVKATWFSSVTVGGILRGAPMSKKRHISLSFYLVVCICTSLILAGIATWFVFRWDVAEPIKPLCVGGGGLIVAIIGWLLLRKILICLFE